MCGNEPRIGKCDFAIGIFIECSNTSAGGLPIQSPHEYHRAFNIFQVY